MKYAPYIAVIIAAAVFGAWYFLSPEPEEGGMYTKEQRRDWLEKRFGSDSENAYTANGQGTPVDVTALPAPNVPEGWRLFEGNQYNFSVYVPPGIAVDAFDEGGRAKTFTFQNDETGEGFQIFVLPYTEEFISEERFRRDIPSGVIKDQVEVIIGGKRAVAFFSEHTLLGETREVWFIHNGYLYEVTSFKQLDEWLSKVMETWRFTK